MGGLDSVGSLQRPVAMLMKPLFRFLWRIQVEGLENVPQSGAAILCPNHLSAIDSFLVPAVLPRGIMYVGKAEYLDDWKTAKLFPAIGMIPIDRRGGDHAQGALDAARGVLDSGGLFGIYPEGTRSRSTRLHKGHTGAARLAIETDTPIIPVGLVGTLDIQPPDRAVPRPFRHATIRFGQPIEVGRYRNRIGDRVVYRELIDEVMFEIGQLSGQAYENTYAGAASTEPVSSPGPLQTSVQSPIVLDVTPSTMERRSSVEVLAPRPLVGVD